MPAPEARLSPKLRALTLNQTATALAISRRTLNAWIAARRIRVTRLSVRTPRILEADLLAFLARSRGDER